MTLSDSFPSLISQILHSELVYTLVTTLLDAWRSSRFNGIYTVDTHVATLELKDKHGHVAVYTKEQHVTFLRDDVFAIQDQAWGDGNLFADYRCTLGEVVDRYKEGYRYKVLISLRATKNKGDQEDFFIQRTIEDGWTLPVGNFQTQIDHPTQELTLNLIFPRSRHPKTVMLIEQNRHRFVTLGDDHIQELPDGRVRYSWKGDKPHLFEGYILKWTW